MKLENIKDVHPISREAYFLTWDERMSTKEGLNNLIEFSNSRGMQHESVILVISEYHYQDCYDYYSP